MSWNPFKRRDEELAEQGTERPAAPLAMQAGEDDPTDPLINTAVFAERSEVLRQWPGASLERISIGSGAATTDSFLRLAVEQEGALSRALPQLLTRGGPLFGLRDLLADASCALAASLEDTAHGLESLREQLAGGQAVLRPLDLLLAVHDLAAGLEQAREHGLGWPVDARSLGFVKLGEERPGLGRWQLRFTGFGDLREGHATDAQELITLLRPLLDDMFSAAGSDLLPAALHRAPLQAMLDRLQNDNTLDLARLRDAIASALGGMQFRGHGLTDTGMKRQHNEDAWCIADVRQQAAVGSHFLLAAVADGMGGHESGEIASSLALAMLRQQLQAALTAPSTRGLDPTPLPAQLATLVPGINRALSDRSAMDASLTGMGTTLCGFALVSASSTLSEGGQRSAAIFNVGDSRCYLIGPGSLRRLSSDHSFVQELVDRGEVTEEQAFDHPRKNVITRCLGGDGQDITADVWPFQPGPCERILVCSDGLTDALRDTEIRQVLADSAAEELPAVAQRLVDAANAAGGPDNITVLLLECLL